MPLDISKPEDGQSPLIRFRGVLKEYIKETYTPNNGGKDRERVSFNFTDVEVLEATEPYTFPIATIPIGFSKRSDTNWSVVAASMRKILPTEDADMLIGRQQEWYYGPAKLRRPIQNEDGSNQKDANGKDIWAVQDSRAWQVVWVDGLGSNESDGVPFNVRLADLADGKTDAEFYAELVTSPVLKKLPEFISAVGQAADRTLLSDLERSKLISRDSEGIWHKA